MAVTSALVDNATRTGSSGTTSTVTGVQFGTAAAGRVLVVPFASSNGNDPSACTIGGVTATLTRILGFGAGIASAVVASGTSGNVVFTYPSSDLAAVNGVVALTGAASATPSDTIVNDSAGSGNIDVGAGGSLVAYAVAGSSGAWTGATGLRTDASIGITLSTASFDNGGGALTNRAVSYSTGFVLAAAAFDAAGGGGGVSANPTGIAGSGAAGTPTVSGKANVSLTGASSTASAGTVTVSTATNISANVTGVSSTASAGIPTVAGKANVAPTGVNATASAGTPTVSGKGNTNVTGTQATASAGTPTVTGRANVTLTGASSTSTAGDLTVTASGATSALISGVAATPAAGTPTVTGLANVSLTGASGTAQVGSLSAVISISASLTGVAASPAVGTLTETGKANVTLDGVAAIAAAGDVTASVPTGVSVTLNGVMATLRAGNITVSAGDIIDGSGRRRDNYSPFRIYSPKELERLLREEEEAKKPPKTETAIPLGLSQISLAAQAPVIAPQKPHIGAVDLGVAAMMKAKAEYDDDEESAALLL